MAEYAPTVDRVPGQAFLVLAFDAEGSADKREQALDGHLTHIEKNVERYLAAGPLSSNNWSRSANWELPTSSSAASSRTGRMMTRRKRIIQRRKERAG